MTSRDKVLLYFKFALNQVLRDPLAIPHNFSRIINLLRLVRQGEKRRAANEVRLGVPIPDTCVFSVTWRCNLDCKGCYAKNYTPKKELRLAEVIRVVNECSSLGTYIFVIAGGEPLLLEGIVEELSKVKDAFFLLFSNGTLLDSERVRQVEKAKNIMPIISIEGGEPATDERRGEGVSQAIARAMQEMNGSHVPFGFSTMLTHLNLREVTQRHWVDQLWRRGARFGFFIDYIPMEGNLYDAFVLTDEDREYKEGILLKRKSETRPPIFNLPSDEYAGGGCKSAGKGFIHINADGYVEPCPFSHYAVDNVRDKPMSEILNSDFFGSLRDTFSTMENPIGECMLFANGPAVRQIAEETRAFCTEG
jgi:MoaA/NifB/PqqE/SkfB family radical SAM enzyme